MSLIIGCDKRTGFPCVGLDKARFASLIPLTKPQVEAYLRSRQATADFPDPFDLRRLESFCERLDGGRYVFDYAAINDKSGEPERIAFLLARRPLKDLHADEAVLATNIRFCADGCEFGEGRSVAPDENSEADRILRWLGARSASPEFPLRPGPLPSLAEYGEIDKRFDLPAAFYLRKTWEHRTAIGLDRVAAKIVGMLMEKERFEKEMGLPFLSNGIWELTGDLKDVQVWAGKGDRTYKKPVAAGSSRFLPYLPADERNRVVLIEHHPAIGFRPVIAGKNVGKRIAA